MKQNCIILASKVPNCIILQVELIHCTVHDGSQPFTPLKFAVLPTTAESSQTPLALRKRRPTPPAPGINEAAAVKWPQSFSRPSPNSVGHSGAYFRSAWNRVSYDACTIFDPVLLQASSLCSFCQCKHSSSSIDPEPINTLESSTPGLELFVFDTVCFVKVYNTVLTTHQ